MSVVRLRPEAPLKCGSGSVVEHRLAKARVASSNLVFRSISSSGAAFTQRLFSATDALIKTSHCLYYFIIHRPILNREDDIFPDELYHDIIAGEQHRSGVAVAIIPQS